MECNNERELLSSTYSLTIIPKPSEITYTTSKILFDARHDVVVTMIVCIILISKLGFTNLPAAFHRTVTSSQLFFHSCYATYICVYCQTWRERESVKKYDHNDWFRFIGMCTLSPENNPVLVMERMEMNLGTHLTSERNANLPLQRKLEILGDVLQGLHHMHTHTPVIIHRDLTAGNVLYT